LKENLVDARGLGCPQPVVLARKAILADGIDKVRVVVDNDAAAENVQRMAATENWETAIERAGDDIHVVLIKRQGLEAAAERPADDPPKIVVLITSDLFGSGDEQLGWALMRAFIRTFKDIDPPPRKMLFANAGVRLTTEGSDLIEDLKTLEQLGVEILSCGTCLDYYGLVDSLRVGAVTNMYEMASALLGADRVVRP